MLIVLAMINQMFHLVHHYSDALPKTQPLAYAIAELEKYGMLIQVHASVQT